MRKFRKARMSSLPILAYNLLSNNTKPVIKLLSLKVLLSDLISGFRARIQKLFNAKSFLVLKNEKGSS